MDNDDFLEAIKDITVERTTLPFELNQLKIEHFYWQSGDLDGGMPVSTSIELTSDYNFQNDQLEWKKIITHNYYDLNNWYEVVSDTRTEKVDNPELINAITKYDLRDLKNNYFTEEKPERFTRWEITYNYHFKIVGTYDQEIKEFKNISDLLELKKVIDEETKKIEDKRVGN